MKKRLCFTLLLVVLPLCAEQEKPDGYHYLPAVGWYWYNRPQPVAEEEAVTSAQEQIPDTPTSRMSRLQAFRDDLMNEAMLHPSVENIRRYKIVQDWMVNQASLFAARWEKVLLDNPELDYSLTHPFYNGTANIQHIRQRQRQQEAIRFVNQRYGVFFFYRGQEPLDNRLGSVVKEFSAQYGLTVVPVTIDGRINPDLPDSRIDSGQAGNMQIEHFPAIYLVEPNSKRYQPLAYGFITQDDLARRMLNVVTDFSPED
ncbi:type-F conjugative transfer system pilin assembly protein TraF [Pantoea sp. App145]|uniref:type-F conjugative transfer system pilin assembly protein TraF n=1 Tax=Pantoea sp. App145 TaxID=3071567 RepID=UPI003A8030E1